MHDRTRRPTRLAIAAALTLLAAACSSGAGATVSPVASAGAQAALPSPRGPSPSPDPSPSPALSPTPSPSTALAPVIPNVRITSPAPGTARSGPATSDLTWTTTDAESADVTEEYSTGTSPDLDCARVAWRTVRTFVGAGSPLPIADALPGHCYRFLVSVHSVSGQLVTATSGTLWIYPTWRGGVDLYRNGVFASQQTIDWCVPASVEMILNIVDGRDVHSYAEQAEFYRYGRAHAYARYPVPGLDPKASAALLARAGQAYADYRAGSLSAMEREAVRQLRRTGKPVLLYVEAGIHAWVLDGFTASADPATTDAFTITSFSVLGPLWPNEQYHRGYYDMPPDTKLSPRSFAAAVGGPYHERTMTVPWEGWWVITEPR